VLIVCNFLVTSILVSVIFPIIATWKKCPIITNALVLLRSGKDPSFLKKLALSYTVFC